jgi:hypothetical protein
MKQELRNALVFLQDRAKAFHGFSPNPARLKQATDALGELIAPGDPAAAAALIRESWSSPAKMQELCALRIQQINNYVHAATDMALMLFEEVTLADDERPAFQNLTQSEISVGKMASEGKPRRINLLPPQANEMIDLYTLATEEVEYSLKDIYNGDISAPARASVDLARDFAGKLDSEAFTLLTAALNAGGAFGTFVTTGTKVGRTFVTSARVNASNLPTTNELVLSNTAAWPYPQAANSSSTKFRVDVIRAANRYADLVAVLGLQPTGLIFVPSLDASDLSDEITTLASASSNSAVEGLLRNYTNFFFQRNWTLVPNATLAPGKCYVQFNQPVGYIYRKPSQDLDHSEVDMVKNRETRFFRGVVGAAIPGHFRPRALRITYRT